MFCFVRYCVRLDYARNEFKDAILDYVGNEFKDSLLG